LKHNFYGAEHLLLGVVKVADGKLGELFASRGITFESIRQKAVDTVGPSKPPLLAAPPFTPRAMLALQLAGNQATQLGADRVTVEHLVLGIIDEGQGVAAQLLAALGCTMDEVRQALPSSYND